MCKTKRQKNVGSNTNKQNDGWCFYIKLLFTLLVFAVLFILSMIGLRQCIGFEIDNNSIALTLIGVLATFIVISNYSQVKEIDDRVNNRILNLEKELSETKDKISNFNNDIGNLKETREEQFSDINKLKISISNFAYNKIIETVYYNVWGRDDFYDRIDKFKMGNSNYIHLVKIKDNDDYFIGDLNKLIKENSDNFDWWIEGVMADYARRKAYPLEDDGTYRLEWLFHTKDLTANNKNAKVYDWCVKREEEINRNMLKEALKVDDGQQTNRQNEK